MISLDDIKMEGTEVPFKIFLRSIRPEDREVLTLAAYECLKRNWPVNRMELGYLARELRRKNLVAH